jgi:hypothetical protein
MQETRISLPELGLVAGTRAAIGAGIALLLSDRLSAEQRRAVGWTLLVFGALSTIPLAFEVLGHRITSPAEPSEKSSNVPRSEFEQRFGQRDVLART